MEGTIYVFVLKFEAKNKIKDQLNTCNTDQRNKMPSEQTHILI
jgi:hypothetical protein